MHRGVVPGPITPGDATQVRMMDADYLVAREGKKMNKIGRETDGLDKYRERV